MSSFPEFESFFREAWGVAPFPWQQRLADRVQQGLWPGGISLPTASGKTACIDIAVWALAAQAGRPPEERSAPRRIVFVIDRRVVVDEAWERARTLAARLREAASGPLSQVAARLRTLSNGYGEPLTVHRLRGGTLRDESWLRTPEQPAILLSTVDQVGSRLLFRGYGVSPRMAPIHAGLLAHDTLLVLDEAHCAEPFAETLRAIARLRQVAEAPLPSPFQLVVMSATLPPGTSDSLGVEATDLADPVLGRRLSAAKPARLVVAREAKGEGAERLLAEAMAREAESLLGSGHDAVAVMVNRILTARAVHALLEKEKGWDAVLLIGRMRPLDRDALLERWRPLLAAISGGREKLARPVVVVATQTLEVGANLDFSGLVTEAAPIDSLRQRFGRLNRLGESERAAGVVVVRADQAKKSDDDPVYGDALAATWRWLVEEGGKKGVVDFGVEALDDRLAKLDGDAMRSLLAPTSPAPTLLPAHLDLLAQTSPIPEPEPDISLFLHGTRRASPEVQIVWRADLGGLPPEEQPGAVALLPPTVGESLSTPLWLARKWLRGSRAAALLSDLEGELSSEAREETEPSQKVLVWRGADDCGEVTANQLRPGDTLILPVEAGGFDLFGHVPADRPRDLAEEAFQAARDRVILRAHPAVLEPWRKAASVADLLALAVEPPGEIEPATLRETLQRVADADVPDWLRRCALLLAREARRTLATPHPGGGTIFASRRRLGLVGAEPVEELESDGLPVPLATHLRGVGRTAAALARACELPGDLASELDLAGRRHDLGKADPRFQQLLRGGNPVVGDLLAKSGQLSLPAARRPGLAARCGLSPGWRHELLSAQMVGASASRLVRHLVAAHHGFARPLPPGVADPAGETVSCEVEGELFAGSANLSPADRWAFAESFWALCRRYGWWGLAWLEGLLRLADHRQSEAEARTPEQGGDA